MLLKYAKDLLSAIGDVAESFRQIKYLRILKPMIDPYYFDADKGLTYLNKANIRLSYMNAPVALRDQLREEFGDAVDYLPYTYLEMRLMHHRHANTELKVWRCNFKSKSEIN